MHSMRFEMTRLQIACPCRESPQLNIAPCQVTTGDRKKLKTAMGSGRLHEELLNRRQKQKHDKYC